MSTALITGATAGIGREFARALAADGYGLVLVARDSARLDAVAAEFGGIYRVPVEVIPADLSTDEGLARVLARVGEDARPIDVLVNNAGYGLRESFLDTDLEDVLALDAVLNRAVLALSWAAARGMRARGRGGILTVASLAALTTMGPYASAKSAAMVITESLHTELQGTGVTATAVLPGFVRTEFHERAGLDHSLPEIAWLDSEEVVSQALQDARAGRPVSIAGRRYQALAWWGRRLPRGAIRAISSRFGRSE